LDADTALIGAGISLDSSAVLELLVGIEKEFQIEVNPDELMQAQALRTIGTLARFIDGKTRGSK
jgi:acyl carrier protein